MVAYVVPAHPGGPWTSELREFLKPKLPDFMIPAAFVPLNSFPLTPNGKVDRNRLPRPTEARPELPKAYASPRTSLEKSISTIWQDLLHVERVGLHDNFFDLGGHSLLVVQAHARLQETLGITLPVVRLFQFPTISTLANALSDRESTRSIDLARSRAKRQREAFARLEPEEVTA
jgi:acyl carrier protein